MKKNKKNMKEAYVENVIIWLVIFVGFATMFFFTLNYASILRVKDNMDSISDYGANMIALNGVGADIVENINDIGLPVINDISADDIDCVSEVDNSHQIVFITETSNDSYKFFDGQLSTKRVIFNQVNSNKITCTLTVTLDDN